MSEKHIPCPKRLRNIRTCTFGWIDHRFLKDGFLKRLSGEALRLYLFLVLVANKAGLSWYCYDRICTMLDMEVDVYVKARNELLSASVIAYDNDVFQVLSLNPTVPPIENQPDVHRRAFCRAEDFRSLKTLLSQLANGDD